ncbi:UNVERIFIED_CONTAM: hypothetical protein GTU68_016589 [Idotea baltica]|nr:hypothetical protein [Idotea baltica]
MSDKEKAYTCPKCKGNFQNTNSCFPFCSKRCQMIDLGNWSSGSYAIPAEDQNIDRQAENESQ